MRSAPMVPQVAEALAKLGQREHFTADDDLVFPNVVGTWRTTVCNGGDITGHSSAPALPHVRFHDCAMSSAPRRCASSLSDVQAMLAHAHITTTMRYVHYRRGADDARRLASAFEAPVTPISLPTRSQQPVGNSPDAPRNCPGAGDSSEAPTGIEPVYTALQAAA